MRYVVAVLFAALLITACSDSPTPLDPGPPQDATGVLAARYSAPMKLVARSLAIALEDGEARQRLLDDLRASQLPEHKLFLQDYLNGAGSLLLRKVRQAEMDVEAGLVAPLQDLPPMELYMPVPKHRLQWSGGDDILIAVQDWSEDKTPVAAFGTDGTRYTLDPGTAPTTPTLVIGPAEIDLTVIPDRSDWVNRTGPTGKEIGNWSRPHSIMFSADDCGLDAVEDCGGTSGGGWRLEPSE